jgi:oxygen-independent coproporphyrinogen-3 oxidase
MSDSVKHFYCHIPFCPAKCAYCAFVTHVGSLKLIPRYLDALETEFDRLADIEPGGPLSTVYFGGGTPSMLAPEEIRRLLDALRRRFGIGADAEITLEAHPGTVDAAILRGFREAGVTRLSMGAESLNPQELRALGRSHGAGAVSRVVQWARESGFRSVAVDLMYGLPGQRLGSWRETLAAAVDLGPDHLSLYPLSIEPRTVFGRRHREGGLSVPPDAAVAEMYELACELLSRTGYEHYEIANWARPGRRCRHNLAYWRNEEFYGAGVGAHGYLHPERYENARQTKRYMDALLTGESPVAHRERIDAATRLAETIMLRLRLLRDGLDCVELREQTGADLQTDRREAIDRLSAAGLVHVAGHRLLLPEEKALVAHEAISELM